MAVICLNRPILNCFDTGLHVRGRPKTDKSYTTLPFPQELPLETKMAPYLIGLQIINPAWRTITVSNEFANPNRKSPGAEFPANLSGMRPARNALPPTPTLPL